jgi:hypothetical protein
MDDFVGDSPIPPCLALARFPQDHMFDIQKLLLFTLEWPPLIGLGGSTTMSIFGDYLRI